MKRRIFEVIVVMSVMAVPAFSADGIFSVKIGDYDVHTMVEAQNPGNTNILVEPKQSDLDKYLPGGYTLEVNTFLVKGNGRTIVIDTGFGRGIFDHMKTLGVSPNDVDTVLITHMHGDHISGLQKDGAPLFPNARVCLAEPERDYWTKQHLNQGAVAALAAYKGKVETFTPGQLGSRLTEVLPGISPIAAYGHTPGHTMYLVSSKGASLIVWGDIMHVQNIQFPVPDQAVSFDTDPKAAAVSRRQALDYAAKNKIPIAGHHIFYPAIGMVEADGAGYRFVPMKP
jgi:glyoxylase-like metal-dependent hydrolase (beta-lactamase superfamily II)